MSTTRHRATTHTHPNILFFLSMYLLFCARLASANASTEDNRAVVRSEVNALQAINGNPSTFGLFSPATLATVPVTTCRMVTADFINRFYASNTIPIHRRRVTRDIMAVRNMDPVFAQYIDVVFNYQENLQIIVATQAEYSQIATTSMKHSTKEGYAALRIDFDTSLLVLRTDSDYRTVTIRHELRHIFMTTLQQARMRMRTFSADCPFRSTAEAEKIDRFLALGDGRVTQLRAQLERETKHQLSSKEITLLTKLRALVPSHLHQEYLRVQLDVTPEAFASSQFQGNEGKIYDLPLYGGFHFIRYERTNDKIIVYGFLTDPLWALVTHMEKIEESLKHYEEGVRRYEKDASLFGNVPLPLIKHFYKEYFNYVQYLTTQVFFPERMHSSRVMHQFFYQYGLDNQKLLTKSEIFTASEQERALELIQEYIKDRHSLPTCKRVAIKLRLQGYKTDEVNLCLGAIAALRDKNATAFKHLHSVFKNKHKMKNAQSYYLVYYAAAAYNTERYSITEKLLKKFDKNSASFSLRELEIIKDIREGMESRLNYVRRRR